MTIQKKIILVLDTECCDLAGNVYDVGYTIADRKGVILTRKNWLVEEVFTDPDKMMRAGFFCQELFCPNLPKFS